MTATPLRVLHVHSDLGWGGVEQWLLHVAERTNPREAALSFFAAEVGEQWDAFFRRSAVRLVRSPRPRRLLAYRSELRRALRERRYDVVHCHFADHCGIVLREARLAGVPCRVAHCHIDLAPLRPTLSRIAHLYLFAQNKLTHRFATRGLAASRAAARSMFGESWESDRRWGVLPCGIELAGFSAPFDRQAQRASLGCQPQALVFAHVGRFTSQKNHAFLIDVARHVKTALPEARFLLIGEGPLEAEVRAQVAALGLADCVSFLGPRTDVAAILRASDAFLFPSRFEGLGLALVEAQAAGLPCFATDSVPSEATVVKRLVKRLPSGSASHWAAEITRQMNSPLAPESRAAYEEVFGSQFNIDRSVNALLEVYHAGA